MIRKCMTLLPILTLSCAASQAEPRDAASAEGHAREAPSALATSQQALVANGIRNRMPVEASAPDYVLIDKASVKRVPVALRVDGQSAPFRAEGERFVARGLRFPDATEKMEGSVQFDDGSWHPVQISLTTAY